METELFTEPPAHEAKQHGVREPHVAMYIIGGIVVVGFFSLMGIMLFVTVPADNVGPVNQLFGALSAAFGTVIGFFYGSSVGSKQNAEVVAEIAKKQL